MDTNMTYPATQDRHHQVKQWPVNKQPNNQTSRQTATQHRVQPGKGEQLTEEMVEQTAVGIYLLTYMRDTV